VGHFLLSCLKANARILTAGFGLFFLEIDGHSCRHSAHGILEFLLQSHLPHWPCFTSAAQQWESTLPCPQTVSRHILVFRGEHSLPRYRLKFRDSAVATDLKGSLLDIIVPYTILLSSSGTSSYLSLSVSCSICTLSPSLPNSRE
jgi:hypothetical protein